MLFNLTHCFSCLGLHLWAMHANVLPSLVIKDWQKDTNVTWTAWRLVRPDMDKGKQLHQLKNVDTTVFCNSPDSSKFEKPLGFKTERISENVQRNVNSDWKCTFLPFILFHLVSCFTGQPPVLLFHLFRDMSGLFITAPPCPLWARGHKIHTSLLPWLSPEDPPRHSKFRSGDIMGYPFPCLKSNDM